MNDIVCTIKKKLSYRDASCQLKSCQLPRNSAETTCTTSLEQIEVMKLRSWRVTVGQCVINMIVHSTMTRSSRKQTTDDLLWRNFSKSTMYILLTWPWPRPLTEHSLITRLRLRMADPCTKFEVSSASHCHCGDITWGGNGKFYKGSRISGTTRPIFIYLLTHQRQRAQATYMPVK